MPTIYILTCSDNRFYIGSTGNFDQRFREHCLGKCKFTKSRLPIKDVYTEAYASIGEARRRELQLKKFKSRSMIEKLIKSSIMASSSNG